VKNEKLLNFPFRIRWIPHFTSVINWNNLLGLGMLKQVQTISEPWIAIMDHSIDIGIKKVLVVLRVRMDLFNHKEGATTLEDCECIGIKISTKVNGETIAKDLEEIFLISGVPAAIIKDRDYTLNKGVKIFMDKLNIKIPIIDDITHEVANALKKQFENTKSYKLFMKLLKDGATKLRQTDIAFLMPPKLRTKGRFQAIGNLTKWSKKILDTKIFSKKGKAKKGSLLKRLRQAFPNLNSLKPFIQNFAKTTTITSNIMKILKTKGLNKDTYIESVQLLSKLPRNSKTKKIMRLWLDKHLKIQQSTTKYSLLISSDIIESLFGKLKYKLERSPQTDMSLSVLMIPTFCETLNETKITKILDKVNYKELKNWNEENIPYTVARERDKFFNKNIQKAEIN
jgi:hypothetical protein